MEPGQGCEALEIRLVTVGIDLLFKHLIRIFQMHLLGSQFLTLQIQGPSDEDAGQSTENGGQSTKGFSKLRTTIDAPHQSSRIEPFIKQIGIQHAKSQSSGQGSQPKPGS